MKIVEIYTGNILIVKDMLIKAAIKAGMQYVEMEEEVLIENNLFRIKKKEQEISVFVDYMNFHPIEPYKLSDEKVFIKTPKVKRNQYRKQSKIVNETLKNNQYYNRRRRYQ